MKPILTFFLAFILTGALIDCGPTDNQQNNAALLLPILSQQNENSAVNTQSCPPASLPEDVFLANMITYAGTPTTSSYSDTKKMVNGICGGGQTNGSTDVFSLDPSGQASYVILEWKSKKVKNSSGVDFIVFENVFSYSSSGDKLFMEPMLVEVSRDQASWCGFAPDYTNSDETVYSPESEYWRNFAGLTPSVYNMATNPIASSELFSGKAGGDRFDLVNLAKSSNCPQSEVESIQKDGFVYIKLTSASAQTNPDTGSVFPTNPDSFGGGPDIDGVIAREVAER